MSNTPSATNARIGQEVQILMLVNGAMTHQQLADAVGVTRPTIAKYLHGRGSWDVDTLEAVAAYFGVELVDLVAGTIDLRTTKIPSDLQSHRSGWISPRPMDGYTSVQGVLRLEDDLSLIYTGEPIIARAA